MADKPKPDTPSGDYSAMSGYWRMVATILDGAAAMRAAGETYLPKFPNETQEDYDYRRKNAKFTNVYRDIVESLAAKPFATELGIKDGSASDTIAGKPVKDEKGKSVRRGGLVEDIDGQGNHLNVFAAGLFFAGINDAISWILVDKQPVPAGATRAVERDIGARPYWVHIPAHRLLAVYSDTIAGKEEIVHARILEPETVRDGFGEKTVNRVRVLNREKLAPGSYAPATYQVWEEQAKSEGSSEKEWVVVGEGPIAIGVISLVPFITGRRKGSSWQFVPPMQDAAYLQIEHFQAESNLKVTKTETCFPMLAANGVEPVMEGDTPAAVPVGPRAVLYAPPYGESQHGEWTVITPDAACLKFLAEDIAATEQQLREIGRQPLTASAGITVVAAALASQKASSIVQAWALALKDALEQGLAFTAQWLGDTSEPEVTIDTDFAIDGESDKGPDYLLALYGKNGLSTETMWEEGKRRNFLSPEFTPEREEQRLAAELPGDDSEDDIAATLPPKKPVAV